MRAETPPNIRKVPAKSLIFLNVGVFAETRKLSCKSLILNAFFTAGSLPIYFVYRGRQSPRLPLKPTTGRGAGALRVLPGVGRCGTRSPGFWPDEPRSDTQITV